MTQQATTGNREAKENSCAEKRWRESQSKRDPAVRSRSYRVGTALSSGVLVLMLLPSRRTIPSKLAVTGGDVSVSRAQGDRSCADVTPAYPSSSPVPGVSRISVSVCICTNNSVVLLCPFMKVQEFH